MTPRRVVSIAAAFIGGFAAVATVAGFFGDIWWGFDLLANLRWQIMWIALGAAIVYALTETGIFTAVFVAAVLANAWIIAPAWIGSQPEATGEDGIRIVHIDLSGSVEDPPSIASWLLESEADLLLLAGVASNEIAQLIIGDTPYEQLSVPDAEAGVVVFGRDQWTLETTRSQDGEAVHLVTVPSGSGIINVVTAWGAMGTSRSASATLVHRFEEVAEVVGNTRNPVSVIGNLGATKWSHASRNLLASSNLRDATEGYGYLSTSPISDLPIIGRWVGIPIDIAYVGPELTPLDLIVGPDIGAEHLPITIVVGPVQ